MERTRYGLVALSALLMIISFVSCDMGGSSDDTPDVTVTAKLHPTSNGRALTNLPVWTKAEVRVIEVELEYDGPNGHFNYEEPIVSTIDLITGDASPSLPAFVLEPGTYKDIELDIELSDDSVTPSILLEGIWEERLIRIKFHMGEEFEAVAGTLIVLEGSSYDLELILNPDDWLSTLSDSDISGATVGNDGYIEFSDSSNEAIFNTHFAGKVDDATEAVLPGGTPD